MTAPVLVVGATGTLGAQVVDELLARGDTVRALVRPSSDTTRLLARGVQIVPGDMLDLDSLTHAMTGVDSVITTAAGYTRGGKNAYEIDTVGNTNLAEAARRAEVRRFVLTGVLTGDQTPDVPSFWHKKLAEDELERRGVPFVALRPGTFLDQIATTGGNAIEKGRLIWIGDPSIPLTFVRISEVATYLASAVHADIRDGERIDVGWDRPIAVREVAALMSRRAQKPVTVRALPYGAVRATGVAIGPLSPLTRDMTAMFGWFRTGRYVADTSRQIQLFGAAPEAGSAVEALTDALSASARIAQ